MYNVPAEYTQAVRALSRVDRLTGQLDLINGTSISLETKNFSDGTVEIARQIVSDEEIEFGSAMLAQLTFALRTKQSRYAFYEAKVTLKYGVQLADGTWYDLPLGVFNVTEADRTDNSVRLVSYDNLLLLDKDFNGVSLYGTPYEIMLAICELCGVVFAHTEEEILALPNGDQAITIDSTSGCNTFRDCMKVVAQMLGTFVVADTEGRIALKQYGKAAVDTLEKKHRFAMTVSDYVCRYAGIVIQSNSSKWAAYDETVETGLELTIQDAPAWDYGVEETLQARADALLSELVQISYTPASVTLAGDPALECGDMIALTTDDETVTTLITGYTWRFRGRMELESVGKNPYLLSVKPQKTQVIRELEKQATINKLIFYSFTNATDIVASGSEAFSLASVVFVTVEDTSAMFLAQLPVTLAVDDVTETIETESEHAVTVKNSAGVETTITDASGNALTLTVKEKDTYTKVTPGAADLEILYYLNGSLVAYELKERMTAGPHILSLFYPFAELNGDSNNQWEVRLRCTGGTATVEKMAFKATVTGQGLAAREGVWDGTINIEEIAAPFSILPAVSTVGISDEVSTETQTPTPQGITETASPFAIRSGISLAGVTEEVAVNPIWEKQTISSARLFAWDYNDRYVELGENGVQLRTEWSYTSKAQNVESGRLTVVKAVTNDLKSVESITLESYDAPSVDAGTTAVLGKAILGKMILGRNST